MEKDLIIPVSLPSQSSRPLNLSHVCVPCVSVRQGKGGGAWPKGGLEGGGGRCVCVGGGGGCGCGVRGIQQYYDYGPHWTSQSERWLWPETLGLPVVLSDGKVQGGKANIGKPGYVNTVNIEKNKQTTTTTQQQTDKQKTANNNF